MFKTINITVYGNNYDKVNESQLKIWQRSRLLSYTHVIDIRIDPLHPILSAQLLLFTILIQIV